MRSIAARPGFEHTTHTSEGRSAQPATEWSPPRAIEADDALALAEQVDVSSTGQNSRTLPLSNHGFRASNEHRRVAYCAQFNISSHCSHPYCTEDFTPVQTPVDGFAFNNGYAYVSGYGNGGGIGICTLEASGIIDNCVNSSSPTGIYGGMAIH